jgi:hypothetical protein
MPTVMQFKSCGVASNLEGKSGNPLPQGKFLTADERALTLTDFPRKIAAWARFITATTSNEYKTSARRSFRLYDNGQDEGERKIQKSVKTTVLTPALSSKERVNHSPSP